MHHYSCKIKLNESEILEIPIPNYKMPDVKHTAGYYVKNNMDLIYINNPSLFYHLDNI